MMIQTYTEAQVRCIYLDNVIHIEHIIFKTCGIFKKIISSPSLQEWWWDLTSKMADEIMQLISGKSLRCSAYKIL